MALRSHPCSTTLLKSLSLAWPLQQHPGSFQILLTQLPPVSGCSRTSLPIGPVYLQESRDYIFLFSYAKLLFGILFFHKNQCGNSLMTEITRKENIECKLNYC